MMPKLCWEKKMLCSQLMVEENEARFLPYGEDLHSSSHQELNVTSTAVRGVEDASGHHGA